MELSTLQVEDRTLYFRDGTSDTIIINKNLNPNEKPEYQFPPMPAKVILDIGANIGVTALRLAYQYPEATIYAFEPEPENFSILMKNVEGMDRIKPFNFGLGWTSTTASLNRSTDPINFGGYSFFGGDEAGQTAPVEIRAVEGWLLENDIQAVDIIKIDCEGSEYSILRNIPKRIMETVRWIEGEAHGVDDFAMFEYLEKFFRLAIQKPFAPKNFNFQAISKLHYPLK